MSDDAVLDIGLATWSACIVGHTVESVPQGKVLHLCQLHVVTSPRLIPLGRSYLYVWRMRDVSCAKLDDFRLS